MFQVVIRASITALVLAFGAAAADAQTQEAVEPANGAASDTEADMPAVTAVYRDEPLRIDGWLDEPIWQNAPVASSFIQGEPVEGVPADQPTLAKVLFDERALYVGVVMYDTEPWRIADQLVRRDDEGQYDYFEFSIDPNSDRRTGYRFRVSAAGVQRDVYLYDDVEEDEAWDAVWQSAVQHDSSGWTAEIRIPLSQIRFEASDTTQSWGVNFSRRRLASNERSFFALESRLRHGKVSAFGRLQGLRLPRGPRRIELRPYALTNAHSAPVELGNPFFDGSELSTDVGLDMRYGLGPAFTLDLTVNPDFGQVEVDPAVINLSAFETFFPEKRPFFVEGAQLFDFSLSGRNQLFYSRRIGREPRGSAPDESTFEDIPTQTTILGAAKVTGRTSGGLSLGALAAVAGRETGSAFYESTGDIETFPVEPRSQFGVLRVQQDFREGASQVGVIVTGMRRDLPADGSFDFLPSRAYSGGIDFEHNWGGSHSRNWALSGFLAGSSVHGSNAALLRLQTSSNHYFQRPDATRFSLDSAATSLGGREWRLQLERRSARHWTGAVWLAEVSPGFEINDLGFSTSGERLDGGARLTYQEITPGKLFRSYRITAFTYHNWRHEALDNALSWSSWSRAHKRGAFALTGDLTFSNYWGVDLSTRYSPQSLSDVATRGGPLMVEPGSTSFEMRMWTDRRAALSLEPSFEYEKRHLGGYQVESEFEISIRPTPSFEIEMEPEFTQEIEPAQYVDSADDVDFAPTFGRRYLFADLRRRSFSLETRVNVSFTPLLTLQVFAQPLISSGDYLTYKQLERSEAFDFDEFAEGIAESGGNGVVSCVGGRTCVSGTDRFVDFDADGVTDFSFADKDFNIRSLRLNAVLRWEYRPGSTVFLVWQQRRRESVNDGRFDLGRDLGGLFGAESENIFILKFNYWIGL